MYCTVADVPRPVSLAASSLWSSEEHDVGTAAVVNAKVDLKKRRAGRTESSTQRATDSATDGVTLID